MAIKLEAKNIEEFLNKVQMDKTQQITECVLSFEDNGLKINANNPPQQARVMGVLKTSAFKEYEAIGKIAISNFDRLKSIIGKFKTSIVSLKVEGNLLSISGSNKVWEYPITDINFISTDSSAPELEFTDTFKLPGGKLQEVFDDVSLIKDAVINIKTEEKKVIITSKGDASVKHTLMADTCKGGVDVKLGEPFLDASSKLKGDLEISVRTDYPVKIMEKTETSVITMIVAPRVDNEE